MLPACPGLARGDRGRAQPHGDIDRGRSPKAMACAVSGALTNLGRKDASRNDSCACSGRRGRSCRPILRLHTDGRLGWRRADLVRRRAAHSSIGHCGARDGRLMPPRPPLPGCRSHCRPRSSCRAGWHAAGQAANRPCEGQRSDNALPLCRRRRGNPDSGLLRFAEVGRSFVRNGARRICCQVGPLLAGASLPMKDRATVAIGLAPATAAVGNFAYPVWGRRIASPTFIWRHRGARGPRLGPDQSNLS